MSDVSNFARFFVAAATALANGTKSSGYTGNGMRKLDFKIGEKIFTAIEQNKDKRSVPGQLAKEGKPIIQLKDDSDQVLLGFVNVEDKSWNAYSAAPEPIDIKEIEQAVDVGEVKIQASGASTRPSSGGSLGSRPAMQGRESRGQGQSRGQEMSRGQGSDQGQNRQQDDNSFRDILGDEAA